VKNFETQLASGTRH